MCIRDRDYDCWHPEHEHVDIEMVIKVLLDNADKAKNMLKHIIKNYDLDINPNDDTNRCLDTAIITSPEFMSKETKNKLKNIAGRVLFKK